MRSPADPPPSPETSAENEARPVLRIVRGVPDGVDAALEVAALTAVLATRGGPEPEPPRPSAWNAPERRVRPPVHPSPDGWRRSALPR